MIKYQYIGKQLCEGKRILGQKLIGIMDFKDVRYYMYKI